MAQPPVVIVMGSDSDWPAMEQCATELKGLGLAFEVRVLSAHRAPRACHQFAAGARDQGVKVIIAAAGMSAALAGAMAAMTTLPVIGVPLAGGMMDGLDALLSTVQMPPGVPVATVSVGPAGARNAAILAAQLLALSDPALADRLAQLKADQTRQVDAKNAALQQGL